MRMCVLFFSSAKRIWLFSLYFISRNASLQLIVRNAVQIVCRVASLSKAVVSCLVYLLGMAVSA